MTPTEAEDVLSALAGKQMRALALLLVVLAGGTGVSWFKADGIGTTLSTVARTSEANTIILGEVRDDVAALVQRQGVSEDRYFKLSERVVVLEGLLRDLKQYIAQTDRGGNGK